MLTKPIPQRVQPKQTTKSTPSVKSSVENVRADVVKPEQSKTAETKSVGTISSISERLKRLNLINRTPSVKVKKEESLADKYLNSDEDIQINAYAKNFTKKKKNAFWSTPK